MKTIYVTIPVSEPPEHDSSVHVLINDVKDVDNYNHVAKRWVGNNEPTTWLKPVTTLAELIKHCPEVREEVIAIHVEIIKKGLMAEDATKMDDDDLHLVKKVANDYITKILEP